MYGVLSVCVLCQTWTSVSRLPALTEPRVWTRLTVIGACVRWAEPDLAVRSVSTAKKANQINVD